MLSERFGEAAGEARAKSKALQEKETLLDAVTAQVRREKERQCSCSRETGLQRER